MATATPSRKRSATRKPADAKAAPPADKPAAAAKSTPARKPAKRRSPQPARKPPAAAKPPASRKRAAAGTSNNGDGGSAGKATREDNPKTRPAKKTGRALTVASDAITGAGPSAAARGAALMAARQIARRVFGSGADIARNIAGRAVTEGRETVRRGLQSRLPVQRSVDVAVPVRVVWREWSKLEFLPEGVHRVYDIERDGDALNGRIDAGGEPWTADILDERSQQSFAWQSREGSDCAGLATFHRLSDRLTRVELTLDVVPTAASEAIALATHLADRRAEGDLRRFKARLEAINPDLYADEDDAPDDLVDGPDGAEDERDQDSA